MVVVTCQNKIHNVYSVVNISRSIIVSSAQDVEAAQPSFLTRVQYVATMHLLRSLLKAICCSTNLSSSSSATSLSSAIPSRSAVQCHIVDSLGQEMRYGMRYVVPVWFDVVNIELLCKEELSRVLTSLSVHLKDFTYKKCVC